MNHIILYKKKLSSTGKVLIQDFINSFQLNFRKDVIKYAEQSKSDKNFEHIFWYGEQQLKTVVTTALSKICRGYLMQEPGVERKINKSRKTRGDFKNGRVDYWCRIGENTKISILVEVKQGWIRYYSPDKWTIYRYALDRHESAKNQVNNISKSDFIVENLYGIAMTVLPMFIKYDSDDQSVNVINKRILDKICRQVVNTEKIHACGGFALPNKIQEISIWPDKHRGDYESYPGIIFLWSIYKFTKN